jgi:hypothetical protein
LIWKRFNLKKLNNVEVNKECAYQVKVSNRLAALKSLDDDDDDVDISMVWKLLDKI